ncbi:MAG: glycosyltransferase [Proteobacteria bacterium]|nr:glycosyltransferase [Pseudomonadota bacterium]MBU1650464.1 glycosyltransferase [Pseudomonadota bacterium]
MDSPFFLSVLIPVYNWDVGPLLTSLSSQCLHLSEGQRVEIIVMDDGSTERFTNRTAADQLSLVRYEESSVNKGRAEIRNALLQQAKGVYVLFLDADMLPDRDDFIQTYLEQGGQGSEIVCGGISYCQNKQKDPEYSFYLYKSGKTEALPSSVRKSIPWRYLFTSNIMVRRDIMESVQFDPRFTGYGFEDIEWGIRLGESFTISHIDNTCSHMGVMSKQQVFSKMRDSVQNYALFLSLHPLKIGRTGAAGLASFLKHFPDGFLSLGDVLLSRLFTRISWNWFLFFIFQCTKAVLLARVLKKDFKI